VGSPIGVSALVSISSGLLSLSESPECGQLDSLESSSEGGELGQSDGSLVPPDGGVGVAAPGAAASEVAWNVVARGVGGGVKRALMEPTLASKSSSVSRSVS